MFNIIIRFNVKIKNSIRIIQNNEELCNFYIKLSCFCNKCLKLYTYIFIKLNTILTTRGLF